MVKSEHKAWRSIGEKNEKEKKKKRSVVKVEIFVTVTDTCGKESEKGHGPKLLMLSRKIMSNG